MSKWWPTALDCSAKLANEQFEKLEHQIRRFYAQPWFWAIMGKTRYGAKISAIRQQILAAEKKGNAMIGYWTQLNDMRQKLDRLNYLPVGGNPKVAGEAFGDVMVAASGFLSYAPKPFDAYAEPLKVLGQNFGKIADMMSVEHRGRISGYTPGQINAIMNRANDPTGDWSKL